MASSNYKVTQTKYNTNKMPSLNLKGFEFSAVLCASKFGNKELFENKSNIFNTLFIFLKKPKMSNKG
jgi:hypothetical protein